MTDNDKALVERLREDMADVKSAGYYNDEHRDIDAACDRIETLNAMLKAAEESLGDQLAARKEQADRIEAQAAEIERLHEAGNNLGFYAGHEDACDCVKGWAKGPCNCGYTEAWQAWHSLAGKAEQ